MKITFFCIANTNGYGEQGKKEPVEVEKYDFDWDKEEDREAVEDYIEEELTEKNFSRACYNFLVESEIDWGQRGVPYLLLDQDQVSLLGFKIWQHTNNANS